ncbi:MAG: PIN domain-containing protein [Candidatus Hydrogenedentes bacterium]|nr:PIN domain-containing protein [Candidatus Hydrogenedentota bacterium]
MIRVFADTSFYVALVSPKDQWHSLAARAAQEHFDMVTTEFVLIEVGNFLHRQPDREMFIGLLQTLSGDDQTTIVPASTQLFEAGSRLYSERPDKDWSFTDCTSFVVMNDLKLVSALSNDHYFRQAGFQLLMSD